MTWDIGRLFDIRRLMVVGIGRVIGMMRLEIGRIFGDRYLLDLVDHYLIDLRGVGELCGDCMMIEFLHLRRLVDYICFVH